MVIFFCHEELISIYKALFSVDINSWFEKGSVSISTIEVLAEVLHYFDNVVKKRNSRRAPLAAELTFEIIRYYVNHHQICITTKDVALMKAYLDNLLLASSTKVFKIVNQIVDLSQKSKFALSFNHILKQLDFKHHGLLAHVRNGFFHQEMPASGSLLSCFESLLIDMKRLYWDKVFAWYSQTFSDRATSRQQLSKFGAQILDKACLNDVDEYSDRCLVQQDLQVHLGENLTNTNEKEAAASFIKHKVKGLHRKTVVALLAAVEAEKIAKEQLVSVTPLPPMKARPLGHLLAILQQLLEIFQSNENMHSVLKTSPLAETASSLLCILKVTGGWDAAVSTFDKFLAKSGSSKAQFALKCVTENAELGKRTFQGEDELMEGEPVETNSLIQKRYKLRIGYKLQQTMAQDPEFFTKAIKAARQLTN